MSSRSTSSSDRKSKILADETMDTSDTNSEENKSIVEAPTKKIDHYHNTDSDDFSHLQELFKHHIESFDHLIESGIETMLSNIKPAKLVHPQTGETLSITYGSHEFSSPRKEGPLGSRLLPTECRLAKICYSGPFKLEVCFTYNGGAPIKEKISFGTLPVMLKSKLCHLRGADARKLISYREERTEMGGYFILNGLERLVRLLIMQKRNYPMSMVRDSFRDRQDGYTDKAAVIRYLEMFEVFVPSDPVNTI